MLFEHIWNREKSLADLVGLMPWRTRCADHYLNIWWWWEYLRGQLTESIPPRFHSNTDTTLLVDEFCNNSAWQPCSLLKKLRLTKFFASFLLTEGANCDKTKEVCVFWVMLSLCIRQCICGPPPLRLWLHLCPLPWIWAYVSVLTGCERKVMFHLFVEGSGVRLGWFS